MNSQMGLGRRSLNGVDHWESNISADCFLHGTNILILPGDGTNGEYDAAKSLSVFLTTILYPASTDIFSAPITRTVPTAALTG